MTSRSGRSSRPPSETDPTGPSDAAGTTANAATTDITMDIAANIERVYRAEWGRLLSLLVSRTRRLDVAEDALGEALCIQGDLKNALAWFAFEETAYRIGYSKLDLDL